MNTSLKKELEHNAYVCICVSVCIYIQTHTHIERNIYIYFLMRTYSLQESEDAIKYKKNTDIQHIRDYIFFLSVNNILIFLK